MSPLTKPASRIREDEKGNVAITFGVMSCVMLCAIGAAVDFGRAFHATDSLQAAADAAATAAAAAASATTSERISIARNYFTANSSDKFDGSAQINVSVDGQNNVNVIASANVPAAFSKLLGVDHIPIEAKSAAGNSGQDIEVAMMIDVTGSMGSTRNGMTKIAGLKLAANDLLNIFFPGGATTSSQVKVAIAPMADYVNAGQYAATATGLASRGAYANVSNLKSTKHGPFSGNYSGSYGTAATSQPLGSQAGATAPSSTQSGATFDNAYCADPNAPPTPITQMTYSTTGVPAGVEVSGSGTAPTQLMQAGTTGFYRVNSDDNSGSQQGWEYFSGTDADSYIGNASSNPNKITGTSKYYVPLPASITGVEYLTDPATGLLIGMPAFVGVAGGYYPQIKAAGNYVMSTNNSTRKSGYKKITGFSNGNFTLASGSVTTGFFIPVPIANMIPGGVLPQCTSGANQTGYLVTCVTERTGTDRYDDKSPANGGSVGPYNQAAPGRLTNKLNYSEDGKCYSAGRELPAIIPLTSSRADLDGFFSIPDNQLIGGSTPGHLGHAWAWYMLSPNWNGVWSDHAAAEYSDKGTKKYAIIMTDGEYNTQYSDVDSATQALALCQGMKDAGITVFTVGFGFANDAEGTAAGNLLRQCASDNSHFFFPYDGAALRTAFQQIGAKITGGATRLVISQ